MIRLLVVAGSRLQVVMLATKQAVSFRVGLLFDEEAVL